MGAEPAAMHQSIRVVEAPRRLEKDFVPENAFKSETGLP